MAGGLMRIRTAALAVVMAAGLVGGVATAASAAETRLGYTCSFPSGKAPVGVTVAATFPKHAEPGTPFQPTGVATTVAVPRSALGDLAKAATVSATTQLTVKVAQDDGQPADAGWLGDAPATKVPAGGDLTLTAPGDVPTVTVTTDGTVVFTAAKLDLTLTPDTGSPVQASCTPDAGQRTTLGSVPVGNATATASPTPTAAPTSAKPSASANPTGGPLPKVTGGATTPGARSRAGTDATPATALDAPAFQKCANPATYVAKPFAVAAYVAGYANVQKVNGAAVVGSPDPGSAISATGEGLQQTFTAIGDGWYFCGRVTFELNDNGVREFPVVTTTAPAFGFVPVTATAHISQVGDDPLQAVVYQREGPSDFPAAADRVAPYTVVSTARVSMRLSDVKVNGVPLDVGNNCRTSRGLYTPGSAADPNNDRIVFTGGDTTGNPTPIYANPLNGGASAGDVQIPPFQGCVTPSGDDLDKLLTSTVSGADNYSKIVQGPLCPANIGCVPGQLQPVFKPLWTLTHGGPFDGSGPIEFTLFPSVTGLPPADIKCAAHTMSGIAYNGSGPPRGDQAMMRLRGIRNCTDQASGSTWTITQQGETPFNGSTYDATTGLTKGRGLTTFTMTRTSAPRCSMTVTGAAGITYSNPDGVLRVENVALVATGEAMTARSSTCADFPASEINDQHLRETTTATVTSTYTLPPDQAFTLTSP
ncbi:MAG TPA: DUF6801 domain-containing protein [Streptosporangiaceae bacterium]|jgi:hypothetical protein